MDIVSLAITWLVTSVSFFIISKLPIGVDIDSFGKAMISAAVFGLLNALVRPIFVVFGFPLLLITFGLWIIVINAAIFGLAAWLVEGFRLRWGIWSALLGALALGFINSLLDQVLRTLASVR
jgi:putative membrane protein